MNPKTPVPCLALAMALVIAAGLLSAQERVSRQTPGLYETVAELMTPLEVVQREAPAPKEEPDTPNLILLRELIDYVSEDGRRLTVDHRIVRVESLAGVENAGRMRFGYNKDTQELHLPVARVIQPDGTRLEVQDDAAFLSSPQYQASSEIYDDHGVLTVIFPKVKKGSVIETVLVYRSTKSKTPGELTTAIPIRSYQPHYRFRWVADLPDRLAKRARIITRGSGTNTKIDNDQTVGPGRKRWIMEVKDVKQLEPELYAPPPVSIAGVRLTTFKDWNAVGRWYNGLISGRDQLGPELQAQLKSWVPDSEQDRDVIIAGLLDQVSNQVRYTGLEFGMAALQPRDCNEVWEVGYGDCKDKSNLLRSLLAACGIESHLVLINSGHRKPDRNVPDYRDFNHCILAIPDSSEESGYLFCDPAVEGARPGILPASDSDRDVLVIQPDRAVWARTPAGRRDEMNFSFELEMDHDGRTSGWITVEAKGFVANTYRQLLRKASEDERRRLAQATARQVSPHAVTPDVKLQEPVEDVDPDSYTFKAFLVSGGSQMGGVVTGDQLLSVGFPGNHGLPFLGFSDERRSVFPLDGFKRSFRGKIKIPEGISPVRLPGDFSINSPWVTARAGWSWQDGDLHTEMVVDAKSAKVKSGDFGQLFQSKARFDRWLEQPLSLQTGEALPGEQPGQDRDSLGNFPTLSNGKSQLALVNYRFPADGNRQLRREALKRTASMFPDDRVTIFWVGVELASLDSEVDPQKGIERIEPLLKSFRADVPIEDFASGQFVKALCLEQLHDRQTEAIATYREVFRNERADSQTRGNAAFRSAFLARQHNLKGMSVEDLEQALMLDSPTRPFIFCEWVLKAKSIDTSLLTAKMRSLIVDDPLFGVSLVEAVGVYIGDPDVVEAERLLSLLENVGETGHDVIDSEVTRLLARGIPQYFNLDELVARFQAKLRSEVATRFPGFANVEAASSDELSSLLRARNAVANFEMQGIPLLAARISVGLLLKFDDVNIGDLLSAAYQLNWLADQGGSVELEALLDDTLGTLLQVPGESPVYQEAVYIWCYSQVRQGNLNQAREKINDSLAQPYWAAEQISRMRYLLGLAAEAEKDVPTALEAYESAVDGGWSALGLEGMIRGTYLALHAGDEERAVSLLRKISDCPPQFHREASTYVLVDEMINLVRNDQIKAYWSYSDSWWNEWKALEAQLEVPRADDLLDVPTMPASLPAYHQVLTGNQTAQRRAPYHDIVRRLAIGAKFNPAILADLHQLSRVMVQPGMTTASQKAAFLRFIVALGEDLPLPGSVYRIQGMLVGALSSIQLNDLITARRIMDKLERETQESHSLLLPETQLGIAMLRASLAQLEKKGYAEAAGGLTKLLEENDILPERFAAVSTLILIHSHLKGREQELVKIVNRELKHPSIASNPSYVSILENSLKDLTRDPNETGPFDLFAQTWLEKYRPAWYDYAKPNSPTEAHKLFAANRGFVESYTDLRSRLQSEMVDSSDKPLEAEIIKTLLLVGLDREARLSLRQDAFLRGAVRLINLSVDEPDQRQQAYRELLEAESIEAGFRQGALTNLFLISGSETRDFLKTLPVAPQEQLDNQFASLSNSNPLALIGEMKQKESEELGDSIEQILEDNRIDLDELPGLQSAFVQIIARGEFDLADKLVKQLENAVIGPEGNTFRLQLVLGQQIEARRKAEPFLNKARARVLQDYPQRPGIEIDPGEVPSYGVNLSSFQAYLRYQQEKPLVQWIQEVHDHEHTTWNQAEWEAFFRRLVSKGDSEEQRLSQDLFFLGLKEDSPGPSIPPFEWASIGHVAFDPDEPDNRTRVLEFARSLPQQRWHSAKTKEHLWQLVARVRFYGGDPEFLRGMPEAVRNHPEMQILQFRSLVLFGSDADLKSYFDSRGLGSILDDNDYLVPANFAFARIGMAKQAELMRGDLRGRLYREVLDSWSDPNSRGIGVVSSFVQCFEDPVEFPEGWLEAMHRVPANEKLRWGSLGRIYIDLGDWDRVADVSQQFMEKYPTYVDAYYHRGLAAYHLNDYDTASRTLEHIVERSHGRLWRQDALELLAKINPGAGKVDVHGPLEMIRPLVASIRDSVQASSSIPFFQYFRNLLSKRSNWLDLGAVAVCLLLALGVSIPLSKSKESDAAEPASVAPKTKVSLLPLIGALLLISACCFAQVKGYPYLFLLLAAAITSLVSISNLALRLAGRKTCTMILIFLFLMTVPPAVALHLTGSLDHVLGPVIEWIEEA